MKKYMYIIVLIAIFSTNAHSISISQNSDPNLLLNELTGNSSNGTQPYYSGADGAIGTYSNISGKYGIGSGIAISTGNVMDYSDGTNSIGSNTTSFGTSGDKRLSDAAGYPTYDAAKFGFNFQAKTDKISFDFVFGSEEYPEYVGSSFNDVFSVFLTDNKGKVTQIVHDKNGNPININSAFMKEGSNGQLDGTTGRLHTEVSVSKGRNYSIEFAIADASDSAFDSTAFISKLEGTAATKNPVEIYGLFVGANQAKNSQVPNSGLFSGEQAKDLKSAFSNLSNANGDDLIIKTADFYYTQDEAGNVNKTPDNISPINHAVAVPTGGLTSSDILNSISDALNKSDENDIFTLYLAGHGGRFGDNLEQNAVLLGGDGNNLELLWDNKLADVLAKFPDKQKFVIVDSCYSGGFWDELSQIPNIAFLSSVDGTHEGNSIFGRSFFSMGLEEALSTNWFGFGGYQMADYNEDHTVDLAELYQFMSGYKNNLLDPFEENQAEYYNYTEFAPNEYDPSLIGTPFFMSNFDNGIYLGAPSNYLADTSQIPLPSTIYLLSVGLIALLLTDRRNIKSA